MTRDKSNTIFSSHNVPSRKLTVNQEKRPSSTPSIIDTASVSTARPDLASTSRAWKYNGTMNLGGFVGIFFTFHFIIPFIISAIANIIDLSQQRVRPLARQQPQPRRCLHHHGGLRPCVLGDHSLSPQDQLLEVFPALE